MSLLTHFIAADVRRLRLAIVLWVSALLVEATLEHVASFLGTTSPPGMALRVARVPMWVATRLLAWALVPLVLQLHPAVGSHAFWMTRPIAPRLLVAAKLVLLLVLFVGVPLAIEQVVMILNRVPPADMGRVGLQTALHRSVVMAALAAPAALTPNLARFALLCGAALFAFALLPIVAFSIDALFGPPEGPRFTAGMTSGTGMDVLHPQPDPTWQVVGFVLLILTGLFGMAVQYLQRRVRNTIAVVMAGLVLAALVSTTWPWPVIRASLAPPEWALVADALRLHATISEARYNPPEAMHEMEPRWVVQIPLEMTPPPAGWVATARVSSARVDVSGRVLSTMNEFSGYAVLPDATGKPPGPAALQRVMEVDRLLEWGLLNSPKDVASLMLRMPADVVADARTAQAAAELLVDLTKLDVAATMSLGRGRFQDGAYTIIVREVKETPMGVVLHARITSVATTFDRRVRPIYLYFLRNQRLRQAVRGMTGGGAHSVAFAQAVAISATPVTEGGFSASSQTIMFDGRDPNTKDARMLLTRDWLRDAELVIVRATHQGSVRRTLELTDLPLAK